MPGELHVIARRDRVGKRLHKHRGFRCRVVPREGEVIGTTIVKISPRPGAEIRAFDAKTGGIEVFREYSDRAARMRAREGERLVLYGPREDHTAIVEVLKSRAIGFDDVIIARVLSRGECVCAGEHDAWIVQGMCGSKRASDATYRRVLARVNEVIELLQPESPR